MIAVIDDNQFVCFSSSRWYIVMVGPRLGTQLILTVVRFARSGRLCLGFRPPLIICLFLRCAALDLPLSGGDDFQKVNLYFCTNVFLGTSVERVSSLDLMMSPCSGQQLSMSTPFQGQPVGSE